MKYITILFLCLSCSVEVSTNASSLPKVGECFRHFGQALVTDYVVDEIFKNKYIAKEIYDAGAGEKIIRTTKDVFTSTELSTNAKVIDCKDAE